MDAPPPPPSWDDARVAIAAALAGHDYPQAFSIAYGVLHTAIDRLLAGDATAARDAALALRAADPGFPHGAHLLAVAEAALEHPGEAAAARAEAMSAAAPLAPFYETLATRRGEIRRFIPQVKWEVIADCQFDCRLCAHGDLRRGNIGYQLTLDQVRAFLAATRESGYLIGQISIHGSGEPLLWKPLGEALAAIKKSGVVCWTWITTNGLLLHRLGPEDISHLDCMEISLYPDNQKADAIRAIVADHRRKMFLLSSEHFVDVPNKAAGKLPVPCRCVCDGPMLAGDRLYLYCGPPVFGAGKLMGRDPATDLALWTKVAPNYLDRSRNLTGRLDYCAWCWANAHHQQRARRLPQNTTGGNWKRRTG